MNEQDNLDCLLTLPSARVVRELSLQRGAAKALFGEGPLTGTLDRAIEQICHLDVLLAAKRAS